MFPKRKTASSTVTEINVSTSINVPTVAHINTHDTTAKKPRYFPILHSDGLWWTATLPPSFADQIMNSIVRNIEFPVHRGTFMGNPVPRDQCLFHLLPGDRALTYKFGRKKYQSQPSPLWLQPLFDDLLTSPFWPPGFSPDIVLINMYQNGEDSISPHADDEPEIDQTRPIVSVSLGATRTFNIRERFLCPGEKQYKKASLALTHGQFLIMLPGMQKDHLHWIPKEPHIVLPRINMTFRSYISNN